MYLTSKKEIHNTSKGYNDADVVNTSCRPSRVWMDWEADRQESSHRLR